MQPASTTLRPLTPIRVHTCVLWRGASARSCRSPSPCWLSPSHATIALTRGSRSCAVDRGGRAERVPRHADARSETSRRHGLRCCTPNSSPLRAASSKFGRCWNGTPGHGDGYSGSTLGVHSRIAGGRRSDRRPADRRRGRRSRARPARAPTSGSAPRAPARRCRARSRRPGERRARALRAGGANTVPASFAPGALGDELHALRARLALPPERRRRLTRERDAARERGNAGRTPHPDQNTCVSPMGSRSRCRDGRGHVLRREQAHDQRDELVAQLAQLARSGPRGPPRRPAR